MAKYIPFDVHAAAMRAALRTAAQSLSSTIPTSILVTQINADILLKVLFAVATIIFNAVLGGASAYFMVFSRGLPEEYTGVEE